MRLGIALDPRLRPGPWTTLAAVAAALALSLATGCGSDERSAAASSSARDSASVSARFAGIPQQGATLGAPDAPYTMVAFVDLQCPFSARFARDVLPVVLHRFVRTRQLRIELRPVPIV